MRTRPLLSMVEEKVLRGREQPEASGRVQTESGRERRGEGRSREEEGDVANGPKWTKRLRKSPGTKRTKPNG